MIQTILPTASGEKRKMSTVLAAAALSWGVAQAVKVVIGLMRYGPEEISRMGWRMVWAGGMPSAHSALAASCALNIGLSSGWGSPLFAGVLIHQMSCMSRTWEISMQPMTLWAAGHLGR